ncbi:hypothetical protein FJR70_32695 (plasmid) [Bacillus tropicus]|nr:hypothetical protein FJR70_32695 [Bacillus tropicus]
MFVGKEKDTEVKYVALEDAEIFDSANEALEAKRAKESQKNKNFIQISRGLGTKALAYIHFRKCSCRTTLHVFHREYGR